MKKAILFLLLLLLVYIGRAQGSPGTRIDSICSLLFRTDIGAAKKWDSCKSSSLFKPEPTDSEYAGIISRIKEHFGTHLTVDDQCLLALVQTELYSKEGKIGNALVAAGSFYQVAKGTGNYKNLDIAYSMLKDVYEAAGMYEECLHYLRLRYDLRVKYGTEKEISDSYPGLSWAYFQAGEEKMDTSWFDSSAYFRQLLINKWMGSNQNTHWRPEDLKIYIMAIIPLHKPREILRISRQALNMAMTHLQENKTDSYLHNYIRKMLCYMAMAYAQLACLPGAQGYRDSALACINNNMIFEDQKRPENIYIQSKNVYLGFDEIIEITYVYSRLNEYQQAAALLDKALFGEDKIKGDEMVYHLCERGAPIYEKAGDYKAADYCYKITKHYKDSIDNEDTKLHIETTRSNVQLQFEAASAEDRERQEKKDMIERTIRNSIAGILAGSLLFLGVVFRQRNKIAKGKKLSDTLLLNILPAEVAEELKEKGSAAARDFAMVTVMFSDFKNFTGISEKLTPAELVTELNTIFREFDNIMQKHHLEKIKTIGDSYMAAGGLPVPNQSHPEDAVKAAIEIQDFLSKHNSGKASAGKPVFEARIGINTGPVVAGIVGVKKFAYDIWGDTVNTASRMEQYSESGKINISGSTYQLVKDKFRCTYRGKIDAKNKGEIDMYFVD